VVFGKRRKVFLVRKTIFLLFISFKATDMLARKKIFFFWKPIFAIQFSFSFSFLQKKEEKTINSFL
jgi:hypothetical protein